MNEHFLEKVHPVNSFQPVDLGVAANTGDWVSLKGYHRCAIVFTKEPGGVGDDPILTLEQATAVANTGHKPLNIVRVDKKQAATDLSAVGSFTTSTSASPATNDTFSTNTWTNTDLGEQSAIVVIDIKAEDLDIANGFDCIQLSIADAGSTGQLGTVQYFLHDPKYAGGAPTSAIVD